MAISEVLERPSFLFFLSTSFLVINSFFVANSVPFCLKRMHNISTKYLLSFIHSVNVYYELIPNVAFASQFSSSAIRWILSYRAISKYFYISMTLINLLSFRKYISIIFLLLKYFFIIKSIKNYYQSLW